MKFVGPMNNARDPLTDEFPRKMLAGQRGGGSRAQCMRPTDKHPMQKEHVKKSKKKKKKKKKEKKERKRKMLKT